MNKLLNKHWWRAQRTALRTGSPVTLSNDLSAEYQHDWVNIEPVEPTVRLWVKLKPVLIKKLIDLLWVMILVSICYAGFRLMDYHAIEEGCLRYELTPTQVSDDWEAICKD